MLSPYLPNTDATRNSMLQDIGVNSVEELFLDIPEKFRHAHFKLPSPLSELELKEELLRLSNRNADLHDYACFLGAGYYQQFIPSVVGHITGRSEFYTAYTPYQAEVSQGTLQSIYEYQSLVCQLTGMEVSNAGMYDGSTAAAEALKAIVKASPHVINHNVETVPCLYPEVKPGADYNRSVAPSLYGEGATPRNSYQVRLDARIRRNKEGSN